MNIKMGSCMDNDLTDDVWKEIWIDTLKINERIQLMTPAGLLFTERLLRNGIANGDVAQRMTLNLTKIFEQEGLKRIDALKLATNTTSLVHLRLQKEFSDQDDLAANKEDEDYAVVFINKAREEYAKKRRFEGSVELMATD